MTLWRGSRRAVGSDGHAHGLCIPWVQPDPSMRQARWLNGSVILSCIQIFARFAGSSSASATGLIPVQNATLCRCASFISSSPECASSQTSRVHFWERWVQRRSEARCSVCHSLVNGTLCQRGAWSSNGGRKTNPALLRRAMRCDWRAFKERLHHWRASAGNNDPLCAACALCTEQKACQDYALIMFSADSTWFTVKGSSRGLKFVSCVFLVDLCRSVRRTAHSGSFASYNLFHNRHINRQRYLLVWGDNRRRWQGIEGVMCCTSDARGR